MYGYLSKFNKDTGESHHLNNALQGLIKKNKIIKLVI